MRKFPRIYLDRLDKFISSSSYTSVNLYGKLVEYQSMEGIETFVQSIKTDGENPNFDTVINGEFRLTGPGEEFGPTWSTHWFKVIIRVPTELNNKIVYLHWKIDTEALVYDETGHPLQGLNNQDRTDFLIDKYADPNKVYTFLIVSLHD